MNNKQKSMVLKIVLYAFTSLTFISLLLLVLYILYKGIPHISLDLFSLQYNSENVSLMPALINTVIVIGISLLISLPIGIFCAVYLVEYSKKNSVLVKIIKLVTQTLAGIPSIVYGLFGMIFFVIKMNFGYSLLSGALTLAIMVLPTIINTTEEALLSVPNSYREGSFALGTGKIRTIFKIILPSASSGILSGAVLAVGRMIGESAALIYTSGTVANVPNSIMGSGRTLSVHMYAISSEGIHTDKAFATAVVLIVIVFIINTCASLLEKKIKGE